jgi:hypothetical protein
MSNLILKKTSIGLQESWLYEFSFMLGEKKIVEHELIRLKPVENRMRKYIRGLDEYPASFYINNTFSLYIH